MFFNNLVSEDECFYINCLASVTINGKELVRYDYDHFGNLIHRELADGEVQNYFYDLHDQLVKAEIFKKELVKHLAQLEKNDKYLHLENVKKQYVKELFMEIISRNTYYKIEDDILTIAFADSDKPNPDNYLILQREVDDLEYYYYEINSQQYSGVGGFKKVEIYSDKLVIYFQEKQKIYQNSIENLIITYISDKRLNEYIEYIFGESDCEVVVC